MKEEVSILLLKFAVNVTLSIIKTTGRSRVHELRYTMSVLSGLCLPLFQITSIFLCLGLTFGQQDCDDNACCLSGGHKEINDPRRSINSILEAGQSAICDRALAWGWYRFTSYVGGKMPTTKVDELRCGTIHPIWMKSAHPLVSEGTVDRKACINFFGLGDGCFTQLDIKVRNCGEHYVYYLGPTFSCSLAYCAGRFVIKNICDSRAI